MDYIGCGNQFENFKPHPESLLRTAQRFDLNPEHCLTVGDSETMLVLLALLDIRLCVSYGYRHFDQAEELGADLLIDSLIGSANYSQPIEKTRRGFLSS
ncbi:MAG: HAD hydrolase-like protein [Nitrospirales bacterium]|nr:HAD hydrolase-like protein [Nitrospirales bacterium]